MQDIQHILIVDDERDLRETLAEYLCAHGFRVTTLEEGSSVRRLVESEQPVDLAILDITMPGEDGLSLARYLSEKTNIAIMMVTASADTTDRIVGLEMGADDYLAKPVDPRELVARIKAVMRRRNKPEPTKSHRAVTEPCSSRPDDSAETTVKNKSRVVHFGRCRLDLDARRLFDEDGCEICLKAMELELLETFSVHPDRVLSRNEILMLAHNRLWEPFDRSVDIRIARIRRKIEVDPGRPQVIKTVRGIGYMYCTAPVRN